MRQRDRQASFKSRQECGNPPSFCEVQGQDVSEPEPDQYPAILAGSKTGGTRKRDHLPNIGHAGNKLH